MWRQPSTVRESTASPLDGRNKDISRHPHRNAKGAPHSLDERYLATSHGRVLLSCWARAVPNPRKHCLDLALEEGEEERGANQHDGAGARREAGGKLQRDERSVVVRYHGDERSLCERSPRGAWVR